MKNSQSSIKMNKTNLRHIIEHTNYHHICRWRTCSRFGTGTKNVAGLNWLRDPKLLPFLQIIGSPMEIQIQTSTHTQTPQKKTQPHTSRVVNLLSPKKVTVYTYWLGMRVIALLLSPRYQLLSEATPRTIVGTEGTIKVLLPEYQVYKCFIILNNCAIKHFKW